MGTRKTDYFYLGAVGLGNQHYGGMMMKQANDNQKLQTAA
jgi:hypothetical protein